MVDLGRRSILAGLAGGAASMLGPAPSRAATGIETPDLAKAKSEGKVMLYTSLDTKILDSIIRAFTQKYGIRVEYYRGGSVDVTAKVLFEASAGRVQADMVDASDVTSFLVMKQHGLLEPYRSAATVAVPAALHDPDYYWVADRLTQAVIQYNTHQFGTDPPRHWADLTKPRFHRKLVFFSAADGDGAPRLYTLVKYFGWDLLKGFAANHPLRVTTPQLITQILETGERGCGFAQNDNIAWRSKRQNKPTDYLFPSEGVPTEPGAVALMHQAAHPNAARLFYDWWMGETGQKLLVAGGKYSSRTDLAPPIGNPPLGRLKILTLDYAEYLQDRTKILKQMTRIFGGEWGV